MAKMGRPRKEINKTEFEKLCFLQCTRSEWNKSNNGIGEGTVEQ